MKNIVLCIASLVLIGACHPNLMAQERSKPNIVIIVIDDLGWMDLGCQGNKRLHTPNIDRLASKGMRFTDAYSAAPVCSPTRAAIMTGQAPARLRLTNHIAGRDFTPKDAKLNEAASLDHLPLNATTIAQLLKAVGYVTGFIGKWHLAGQAGKKGLGQLKYYPEKRGFDFNLGGCALGGPPSFFDPYGIHNLPDRRKGEYLPDRLADEAVSFIRSHREKPFFLALWDYTVHWPMEAPKELITKYEKRLGPGLKDARYGAMIEAMDAAVGRVLAALDEAKLTENTLIIFTSDNGGFLGVADLRPLRAGKGYLYEGGIRVPMIVSWSGKIPQGSESNVPVISMDLFPTMLAAGGLKPAKDVPLDGENLMPILTKAGKLKRDAIYFHYPNYAWHGQNRLGGAIRENAYMLIENFDDNSVELYDLEKDLSQTKNLAQQMPEKAAQMTRRLQQWRLDTGAAMPTLRKK
ncbi:MAG: DUF4976 domain-containing protein [Gemmataceae bacterium]|nr:DUF4976 domain-containing protein [Gemmataceae bacterium]